MALALLWWYSDFFEGILALHDSGYHYSRYSNFLHVPVGLTSGPRQHGCVLLHDLFYDYVVHYPTPAGPNQERNRRTGIDGKKPKKKKKTAGMNSEYNLPSRNLYYGGRKYAPSLHKYLNRKPRSNRRRQQLAPYYSKPQPERSVQEGSGKFADFFKNPANIALLAGNILLPGVPIPYPGQTEFVQEFLKGKLSGSGYYTEPTTVRYKPGLTKIHPLQQGSGCSGARRTIPISSSLHPMTVPPYRSQPYPAKNSADIPWPSSH